VVGERARDALGVVLAAQREQLEQQVLLGGAVVQEPRVAQSDPRRDRRQRRGVEALRGEDLVRGGQDRLAAARIASRRSRPFA
jgi:hypothetical protein